MRHATGAHAEQVAEVQRLVEEESEVSHSSDCCHSVRRASCLSL